MKKALDCNDLSRTRLDTLSSSELIALADEHGIDIPDDLNRQFIIAELLEVAKEISDSFNYKETINVTEQPTKDIATELPESYNETKIDVVLRNPVSLFVYWDFNEVQLRQLITENISVHLQVCFFEDLTSEELLDSFDIQINIEDREQYILIPGGAKFVRVDLMQDSSNSLGCVLAVSSRLAIPQGAELFRSFQPGENHKIKPILELSGIKTMLKNHFNNYRQSFN